MEKTLGGDRLGSGKKMKVHLHGYERSTHDLGYIWRSTMAAGTLVPFMSELALPGDTFDINLDADIKTHPTIGPLFGSYKVQLDVFQAPIRLYQGNLHNNKLGIGMNMSSVKLPLIELGATKLTDNTPQKLENSQINPSCILAYLGIRGVGQVPQEASGEVLRTFNAIPLLAYWEIYKNYYANKQEEIGAVIHGGTTMNQTIDTVQIDGTLVDEFGGGQTVMMEEGTLIEIEFTGAKPELTDIYILGNGTTIYPLDAIATEIVSSPNSITAEYQLQQSREATGWRYREAQDTNEIAPKVVTFPLENIDFTRENILAATGGAAFKLNTDSDYAPYNYLYGKNGSFYNKMNTQEGLGIKTYQSDMFNNWLSTEWIDGAGGITELTAIDTSGGEFTLDTLLLAKKVYNMLNRIAVSGGSYDDWIDAVYAHDRYVRAESPIYQGGLIKELVFQEVVSNSEGTGEQPLGTLGGRGVLGKKHKGGYIHINVDEPSYIIGIVSLTPRIDYSQGNKWDVHLKTMDDLHKPALDEIGFQELITEQMAWWDTMYNTVGAVWDVKSAGKQPAWLNYMTNINRTYGNFAIPDNEMFMTLNRRYEASDEDNYIIKDLTTYIDPVKFNHIFAETKLDAMNYWTQIAVDITARRKMSAKVMPNL